MLKPIWEHEEDAFGDSWVSRSPRELLPEGHILTEFGNQIAWLPIRYVSPEGLDATGFDDALVWHRNSVIRPYGHDSFRSHPVATVVENAARLLWPSGYESLGFGEDTFIAPSIRTVDAEGLLATGVSFAHSVILSLQYAYPSGSAMSEFGQQIIYNVSYPQTVYPFGQRMTEYGDFTTAQTGTFPVVPQPWSSSAYGQPIAYNLDQHLLVFNDGARYSEYGDANVYIPWDEFAYPHGHDGTLYGACRVEHEIRWIEQHNSHPGGYVGTPQIHDRNRTIRVPWTVFTQYGAALVGRHVEIAPAGQEWLQIPSTHAVEYGNVAFPSGFVSLVDRWGWVWVSRSPRVLGHQQRDESLVFGTAHFDLWERYIHHLGYPWEHEGVKWGALAHIHNRNRTITVPGYHSFRSQPAHLIENAARAIAPYPIEPEGFGDKLFVADRVRYLSYPGIDAFRVSNFGHLIHNAAFLVQAHFGHDSLVVGEPDRVESNLQTIRQHSGPTEDFGLGFIAFGKRTVAMNPNLSAMTRYGVPHASLQEQFILPDGVVPPATGFPVLIGPIIRKLVPRWILQTRYGYEHVVRNVTPQIYPHGRPYTEFSNYAWIDFLNRPLHVLTGIAPPVGWGHAVEYRTRTARPFGFLSFGNSPWGAQVKNALPDPPSARTIQAYGVPSALTIPAPNLNVQFAFAEGKDSLLFGSPDARSQGARIRTWFPYTEYGLPFIELLRQYANPFTLPSTLTLGKPRITPHTIWAMGYPDVPQQAVWNHPGPAFNPVRPKEGGQTFGNNGHPWFGETRITNQVRYISSSHDWAGSQISGNTKFGAVNTFLRRRFLFAHGSRSSRFGFPEFWPHTQRLRGPGFSSMSFGAVGAENVELTLIAEIGNFHALQIGGHEIQNSRRYVSAHGFKTLPDVGWGNRWGNNTPMVHFPREFSIGDFDATLWGGGTWVSHYSREVGPKGFDSFWSYWDDFAHRMRVRSVNVPIQVIGGSTLEVGAHDISNRSRRVSPYMIPPPCIRPCGTKVTHG